MAAEMELPELPPGYRWERDAGRDMDVHCAVPAGSFPRAWVRLSGEVRDNKRWPNDIESVCAYKPKEGETQEDGMRVLATFLWLGMLDI